MPWKDTLKMNEKIDFAMKCLTTSNFRQLCQEHGISAKTGYKSMGSVDGVIDGTSPG